MPLAEPLTLMQEYEGGEKMMVSSSYVWICMTGHGGTEVSVADANELASVLDKFHVSSSHILCITGVPGYHCCVFINSMRSISYLLL